MGLFPTKSFTALLRRITKVVASRLFSTQVPSLEDRVIMDGKHFTPVMMNQQSDLANSRVFPLTNLFVFLC